MNSSEYDESEDWVLLAITGKRKSAIGALDGDDDRLDLDDRVDPVWEYCCVWEGYEDDPSWHTEEFIHGCGFGAAVVQFNAKQAQERQQRLDAQKAQRQAAGPTPAGAITAAEMKRQTEVRLEATVTALTKFVRDLDDILLTYPTINRAFQLLVKLNPWGLSNIHRSTRVPLTESARVLLGVLADVSQHATHPLVTQIQFMHSPQLKTFLDSFVPLDTDKENQAPDFSVRCTFHGNDNRTVSQIQQMGFTAEMTKQACGVLADGKAVPAGIHSWSSHTNMMVRSSGGKVVVCLAVIPKDAKKTEQVTRFDRYGLVLHHDRLLIAPLMVFHMAGPSEVDTPFTSKTLTVDRGVLVGFVPPPMA